MEADYWEWDNKSWTCTIAIDELIVFLMMQNDIISIECSTQIILRIKQLPNAPESGCLWIDFSFIQKYFLLQTKIDEEEPLLNKNMLIALEVLGCQSKKKLHCCFVLFRFHSPNVFSPLSSSNPFGIVYKPNYFGFSLKINVAE